MEVLEHPLNAHPRCMLSKHFFMNSLNWKVDPYPKIVQRPAVFLPQKYKEEKNTPFKATMLYVGSTFILSMPSCGRWHYVESLKQNMDLLFADVGVTPNCQKKKYRSPNL